MKRGRGERGRRRVVQSWTCGGICTNRDRHASLVIYMVCEQVGIGARHTGIYHLMAPPILHPTAELAAHRDRLGRHARAVVAAIAEIKTSALEAPDAMKTEVECTGMVIM